MSDRFGLKVSALLCAFWPGLASASGPPVQRVSGDALVSSRYEGQLVEIEGVVWSSHVADAMLIVRVRMAPGSIPMDVQSPATASTVPVPVDADVVVRGVLTKVVDRHGQRTGLTIVASDPRMVTIVSQPPADPFAVETQDIGQLLRLAPQAMERHRVKVAGVVTRHSRGTSVYVRSTSGAFHVHTRQDLSIQPGAFIEALGFLIPPEPDEYSPFLENGTVRVIGEGPPPLPTPVTASSILSGKHDDDLVRIDGRLIDISRRQSSYRLMLRDHDGVVFRADVRSPDPIPVLDRLRPGSDLRAVGVVTITPDSRMRPSSFHWSQGRSRTAGIAC